MRHAHHYSADKQCQPAGGGYIQVDYALLRSIGETNLVLQPPQATSRDGILGGKSLFPNAYLYSQGDKLELRF